MSLEVLQGPLCNSSGHVILLIYSPQSRNLIYVSLRTGAQIIAMSCICVLCVDQLLSVCVYDFCLWIASSSELLLSFSTPRDTIHSGHYS